MKKKTILNICMVLTVILVAVCGIMAVGSVKGWWNAGAKGETASDMVVSEKTGIAMIERSGVAYEVTAGTAIRAEDHLYTKKAAALTVADQENALIFMGENAEIAAVEVGDNRSFEVLSGEVLVDARNVEQLTIASGGSRIAASGAVLSVSTQPGASMVYVYSGEIRIPQGDSEATVASGTILTMVQNKEEHEQAKLQASSLSDSQIVRLIQCGMDESFCMTEGDLKQVQADREAEIQKARQELLAKKEAEAKERSEAAEKEAENNKKDSAAQSSTTATGTSGTTATAVDADTSAGDDSSQEENSSTEEDTSLYCTIEIRCDTILNNMENLASGKEGYVPSSGTILGTTEVAFTEGETVFDVLQRVCSNAGIQLEYSYTPLYESYYIEGINHLYEFDCGSQSGWMYKVNGWFPNYGCSSYYLEEGDTIVFCYTCEGLGDDVGG